ncbi:MAG: hypothetical protein AAGH68_07325 [Pseudomonadota bacterium]
MIRLFLCLMLIAMPVRAEMPTGHDDPRFQAAMSAWLNADDEASLPTLGALARDGNTAAQILLARIEYAHVLYGPWVAARTSRDRRELFREQSGGFGRSWLFAASENSRLAAALNDSRNSEPKPDTLPMLVELGEVREAYNLSLTLIAAGRAAEVLEHLDDKTNEPLLIRAAWIAALETETSPKNPLPQLASDPRLGPIGDGDLSLLDQWVFSLVSGTQLKEASKRLKPSEMAPTNDWIDTLDDRVWTLFGLPSEGGKVPADDFAMEVARAPESAPLAALCQRRCAGSFLICFRMGLRASGGLYRIKHLGSPVETLIPNKIYRNSQRARTDALDLMLRLPLLDKLSPELTPQSFDQCLADIIEERRG